MTLEFWLSIAALTISIVFSLITLFRNLLQANTASWNTALTRIGQLYDQAVEDKEFASILLEEPDKDGNNPGNAIVVTPKQDIWLANLFMAYEQIYVAMTGANRDSQRAWKKYLINQLNKPTIRVTFLRDESSFSDYHKNFIKFCLGKKKSNGDFTYTGHAIKKEVIQVILKSINTKKLEAIDASTLSIHLFTKNDLPFWKEMYSDPAVKQQMYALPSFTDKELYEYLKPDENAATYVVNMKDTPIGGFTIRKETKTRGTIGIVIHKMHRGRGLGTEIMKMLEAKAKDMKIKVLRADVYSDNAASIKILEKTGFRPFIWFEKNLD